MLRIFRNEGNKTVVVDRNELIKEYVKSYLLRVLVFKDSDFKAENVGLIHDKEKNKIFYGPNFDYEYFSLILKITGIGLLISVACQVLSKSGRDEQATMLSIAGIIIVMIMIITELDGLFSLMSRVFGF